MQCWDIAPAWLQQLTPAGVLVLPLTTTGGVSRSIAFRRDGDQWTSRDAKMCGFVGMQGIGQHAEHRLTISDDTGAEVTAIFDNGLPGDLQLDQDLLAGQPVQVWSGVYFPHRASWADLYLYFACYLDGFCRLSTTEGRSYPVPKSGGLPYAAVRHNCIAHLNFRPVDNPQDGIEFGARGFGTDGHRAAQAIIEQVQAWNATARATEPWFSYAPNPATEIKPLPGTVVLPKTDGSLIIHWPTVPSLEPQADARRPGPGRL